jgi:hypothetical protein
MKTKEKAKELVDKFLLPITQRYVEQGQKVGKGEINTAKQCALIAVDEINDAINTLGFKDLEYWQQVKKEIEKL